MYTGGINFFSREFKGFKGQGVRVRGYGAGKDRACVYNVCTCDRVSICKGIIEREREIEKMESEKERSII